MEVHSSERAQRGQATSQINRPPLQLKGRQNAETKHQHARPVLAAQLASKPSPQVHPRQKSSQSRLGCKLGAATGFCCTWLGCCATYKPWRVALLMSAHTLANCTWLAAPVATANRQASQHQQYGQAIWHLATFSQASAMHACAACPAHTDNAGLFLMSDSPCMAPSEGLGTVLAWVASPEQSLCPGEFMQSWCS